MPFFEDPGFTVYHGDCLDVLPTLEPADAVVTDPPYGLKFMGKSWDHGVPAAAIWRAVLDSMKPGAHLLAFGGTRTHHRLMVAIEDAGFELRDVIMWVYGSGFPKSHDVLKPAWEPIVVARRPLDGTVAANVLAHGTGGINVDACRVEADAPIRSHHRIGGKTERTMGSWKPREVSEGPRQSAGRWPANLIHDGSDEVLAGFPDGGAHGGGVEKTSRARRSDFGMTRGAGAGVKSTGSAARFFYCAKASPADRGEGNAHPTVKPTDLMRYLVRLVTPPGGTVLDPFMGSGSTGKAADLEGLAFVGIDVDRVSCETASRRRDPPRLSMLEGAD